MTIALPFLANKTIGVVGLARTGRSAARAALDAGARVWAWDDNEPARAALAREQPEIPLSDSLQPGTDFLLWSPGVPSTFPKPHPLAVAARRAGLKLVCDVELMAVACAESRFVGITGTNGKSTTTALLTHVLRAAGERVEAGGNIGIPVLGLPRLGPDGIYVLELSSYQLELLDRAAFDVGVLLNITPDHLYRHGGMEGYIAAKASLFDRLRQRGTAIVGVDDEPGRTLFARLKAFDVPVVAISSREALEQGISAPDGLLREDGVVAGDLTGIATLPGAHNWQNACAAFAAGRALGLPAATIIAGLATYPGLAHRQELVGTIDGVRYVNDSKATNADATEKALVCYQDIQWILGGQAKEGGIDSLVPLFGRIRRAYLIGEATEQFAATLDGRVPYERCGTLDVAVARAHAEAKPGDTVLLSPACASWDQFPSFEHRGDAFRGLVRALPGAAPC